MPIDQNYNFTDQELKFSYWYVTHKLLIKNIYIIFLCLASFLIWFYVIWQLVFWGLNYSTENYQINKLIFGDNLGLPAINQLQPVALQIGDPASLISEDKRQDYFIEISNNNRNWLATFDYTFTGSDSAAHTRPGFVLPLEKKYLMDLGVVGVVSDLNISNLKWQRIYNPQVIYTDRFKFKVENTGFSSAVGTGDPSILTFYITNDSAFNYWQVGVSAFLYSGGNVASVNYIVLEQFIAGEKRQVQLNWNTKLPRISNIEIVPEVNVFDEKNIMPQLAPTDFPITL